MVFLLYENSYKKLYFYERQQQRIRAEWSVSVSVSDHAKPSSFAILSFSIARLLCFFHGASNQGRLSNSHAYVLNLSWIN